MRTLKTFFKKEIFAEFAVPARPSQKVVILCDGAPSVPSKRTLMEFFAKKDYWVFHIRYRGTWESKGEFLKVSPQQDVIDVLDELPKGFIDLWDRKKFQVAPKNVLLLGGSFGGPAVILASSDPRVYKTIAIAPVIDWRKLGPTETFERFKSFMQEAYGTVYRGNSVRFQKLKTNQLYAPISHVSEIDGKKLFLIHAKDDDSVPFSSVQKFAKETDANLVTYKTGGHLSSSIIMKPALWKKISKFLKNTHTTSRKNL